MTTVSGRLRSRIEAEAHYRCGYCLARQDVCSAQFHVEHIVPLSAGGSTTEENLWLACPMCNSFKGAQTHARDPLTGRRVRLFNPRTQRWSRHFVWSPDGTQVIARTMAGRATIEALRLNHPLRIEMRRLWAEAGWWPPEE